MQASVDGAVVVPFVGEHVKMLDPSGLWYGVCTGLHTSHPVDAPPVDMVRVQVGWVSSLLLSWIALA